MLRAIEEAPGDDNKGPAFMEEGLMLGWMVSVRLWKGKCEEPSKPGIQLQRLPASGEFLNLAAPHVPYLLPSHCGVTVR